MISASHACMPKKAIHLALRWAMQPRPMGTALLMSRGVEAVLAAPLESEETPHCTTAAQGHMQGGFGPYGGGAGMPAMPPHTMGFQKGSFMQAQQQRIEVTVPVPEARVSPAASCQCIPSLLNTSCSVLQFDTSSLALFGMLPANAGTEANSSTLRMGSLK